MLSREREKMRNKMGNLKDKILQKNGYCAGEIRRRQELEEEIESTMT